MYSVRSAPSKLSIQLYMSVWTRGPEGSGLTNITSLGPNVTTACLVLVSISWSRLTQVPWLVSTFHLRVLAVAFFNDIMDGATVLATSALSRPFQTQESRNKLLVACLQCTVTVTLPTIFIVLKWTAIAYYLVRDRSKIQFLIPEKPGLCIKSWSILEHLY